MGQERGRRGLLFVISAPSGGGKTSLCQRLIAEMQGVVQSVSYTTRAPRAGERDGREYHFISLSAFEARIAAGDFLEWARVHDHLYGTSRRQVEAAVQAGKDVLLAIDVQGAALLRAAGVEAVLIFVVPPSWEVLEARLQQRGAESPAVRARRLAIARRELAHYTAYDYIVVNDELRVAVEVLKAVMLAEHHRLERGGTALITGLLSYGAAQQGVGG